MCGCGQSQRSLGKFTSFHQLVENADECFLLDNEALSHMHYILCMEETLLPLVTRCIALVTCGPCEGTNESSSCSCVYEFMAPDI